MYISIHEPKGIIHIESEASFKAYTKDKIIIEAAGGLVFNEKNELLMIFRRGFWDLPKGKVDEGETHEECAVREVQEETGLHNIKLGDFLNTTYHTYTLNNQSILKPSHWYKMEHWGNEILIPQTEEDISEIKWVSKVEAQDLKDKMYTTIRIIVEQCF
jgi:8-oxo-dGTP pyrophosphatase MutT (NUDIX family)